MLVFFFEKPIYFMLFMRLGSCDHFTKSCPADKTLTLKNFNSKLFLNHLINLLHIWYDVKTNERNFIDIFLLTLILRSKVKYQGQTGNLHQSLHQSFKTSQITGYCRCCNVWWRRLLLMV